MWRILIISLTLIVIRDLKVIVAFSKILIVLLTKYLVTRNSHFITYLRNFIFMDQISSFLCLLSIWITLCMILAMYHSDNREYLFFNILLLKGILFLSFCVNDYFWFFVFFELSLIPTLIIILGWGIQPERVRAGSYLIMYTMVGAIPLLACIIYNFYNCGRTSIVFNGILYKFRVGCEKRWIVFFWRFGFLIKLPIYGVHLWLPKAHVEAPVGGSMILAGVLLKLGAYGLMRINNFLTFSVRFWRTLGFIWFLYTMCVVGLVCFRQSDLKSLVAYSSIAHMSLVILGVFCYDYIGYVGILGMLVAHGVCSSGMFFCVQCFYEIRKTRRIILNRGYLRLSPLLCFFWFLLCVAKASAPPSLNLLSEFLLIGSILNFRLVGLFFCFFSVFCAGLFSIYLYVLTSHSKYNMMKKNWKKIRLRHCLILFLHVTPIYFLFLCVKNIFPV